MAKPWGLPPSALTANRNGPGRRHRLRAHGCCACSPAPPEWVPSPGPHPGKQRPSRPRHAWRHALPRTRQTATQRSQHVINRSYRGLPERWTGPTAWMTQRTGARANAAVRTAPPAGQGASARDAWCLPGPSVMWTAPSTPPPHSPAYAAVTIASTCWSVRSPSAALSSTPTFLSVASSVRSARASRRLGCCRAGQDLDEMSR